MVTEKDPEGRPTVFDTLEQQGLPRVVSVGRLDINTEGLLLLTNDGGLKRVLELPATGWLRRYRVRAFGTIDPGAAQAARKRHRGRGRASTARSRPCSSASRAAMSGCVVSLREGKNREIKNVLAALGLKVNRLIRISFGPFQLNDLPIGAVEVVKARVLREQLGQRLANEAGVDFDSELPEPAAIRLARGAANPALRASQARRRAGQAAQGHGRPHRAFPFRRSPRSSARAAPEDAPMRKDRPGSRSAASSAAPGARQARVDAGPPRKVFHDDGSESEFAPKLYGKKPRPAAGAPAGDKPPFKKSFGDKPRGDFGDRPKRAYGDKPKGDFGDRPKRTYGDKPKGDFGDRPKRPYSGRPAADGADRPKRAYGDKPKGDFADRPKRPYSPRPGSDSPDRPKRPYTGRPAADGAERPKRAMATSRRAISAIVPSGLTRRAGCRRRRIALSAPYSPRPGSDAGDRPKRSFGDKPRAPRADGDRPRGPRPAGAGDKPFSKRPRGSGRRGDRPRRSEGLMRIVAGKFRGKALTSPEDDSIRPTADRVRESVFNILASRLGPSFEGLRVLDLFAGTGALGLEALSRGATHVIFVDTGAEARGLIRDHIEAFGAGGVSKLLRRDATALGDAGTMGPVDLVFLDPPYGKGLGEQALGLAPDRAAG